jgi:hypothetical protein
MFCTVEKFPYITDVFTVEEFRSENEIEQLLERGLISQSIKEKVTKANINKFNIIMLWHDSYNFDWVIVPKEER